MQNNIFISIMLYMNNIQIPLQKMSLRTTVRVLLTMLPLGNPEVYPLLAPHYFRVIS